jgi:hypothetical protein
VAAAADDQHDSTLASTEKDLGRTPLPYLQLQARRRLITEGGPHGVLENLRHVLARSHSGAMAAQPYDCGYSQAATTSSRVPKIAAK